LRPERRCDHPKGSQKTDYEVELGIVIGSLARYISLADARNHVAGYCVVNDVSEREFQIERGGQWTKGKSADTFCPIRPVAGHRRGGCRSGRLALWTGLMASGVRAATPAT